MECDPIHAYIRGKNKKVKEIKTIGPEISGLFFYHAVPERKKRPQLLLSLKNICLRLFARIAFITIMRMHKIPLFAVIIACTAMPAFAGGGDNCVAKSKDSRCANINCSDFYPNQFDNPDYCYPDECDDDMQPMQGKNNVMIDYTNATPAEYTCYCTHAGDNGLCQITIDSWEDKSVTYTCASGYYGTPESDKVPNACKECPDNANCTDGKTFKCKPGYTQIGDKCLQNCKTGQYRDKDNTCQPCPTDEFFNATGTGSNNPVTDGTDPIYNCELSTGTYTDDTGTFYASDPCPLMLSYTPAP